MEQEKPNDDCCKNCHKCEECTKKINLLSSTEIIGWIAIVIGAIAGISQIHKSGSSQDLKSFSIIYLIGCVVTEALFIIQGIMIGNVSIAVTRAVTFLYFAVLLFLWLMYEYKKK
jgi:uncharacterized protein with PQ loop repeat